MLPFQTLNNFYGFLQDSPIVVQKRLSEHPNHTFKNKSFTLVSPKKGRKYHTVEACLVLYKQKVMLNFCELKNI